MAPRHSPTPIPAERAIPMLGVVNPPPIQIQSPKFEGSLATLFGCVKTQKVDLREVPLLPICEAYLCYLLADATPNFDEAATALAALAYLLERKAWSLLPTAETAPEEELFPELPSSTVFEYQSAIDFLRDWHEQRARLFFRAPDVGPDPYEIPFELDGISAGALATALQRVLDRARPIPQASVARPGRSLAAEMSNVLLAISYEWKTLTALVPPTATREDIVYWFLSLLELMRLGQVRAQIAGDDVEFARA